MSMEESKRMKPVAPCRPGRVTYINNTACSNKNGTRMSQFPHPLLLCCYFTFWPIMSAATIFCPCKAAAFEPQLFQSPKEIPSVRGLPVHRVPLRRQEQEQDGSCPYCFALSSMLDLPTDSNILATQVWPSARVAAMTMEKSILAKNMIFFNPSDDEIESEGTDKFTICELGCGPGLPSLTAAAAAASQKTKVDFQVIATDVDEFALDLVNAAANEQKLDHIVSTRALDLIQCGSEDWEEEKNAWMEDIDLFVMSDVFESNAVAVWAARFTQRVLSWKENSPIEKDGQTRESRRKRQRMWVFAQTDRTQREVYLHELQKFSSELLGVRKDDSSLPPSLNWKATEMYGLEDRLWLCDVDETMVNYG